MATATQDTDKKVKTRPCACDCGEETKGGEFLPGHDAKLKSALLNTIRDESAHKNSRKAAVRKMRDRGWDKFLSENDKV